MSETPSTTTSTAGLPYGFLGRIKLEVSYLWITWLLWTDKKREGIRQALNSFMLHRLQARADRAATRRQRRIQRMSAWAATSYRQELDLQRRIRARQARIHPPDTAEGDGS